MMCGQEGHFVKVLPLFLEAINGRDEGSEENTVRKSEIESSESVARESSRVPWDNAAVDGRNTHSRALRECTAARGGPHHVVN